jgi:hypothetical protein
MWIEGAEVAGDGAVEVVRNPASEEPIAEVAPPRRRRSRPPWRRHGRRCAAAGGPRPASGGAAGRLAGRGMKMSGNARELGPEGLESFRETKHVHLDGRMNRKPWWYPYGREG